MPRTREEPPIRHWHTKVAGVSHQNEDGSDRQAIIGTCRPGERLVLYPDPGNAYDPNAVRVCRRTGHQIGFLNAEMAAHVSPEMAMGYLHAAAISSTTGGVRGAPTRGVNIVLVKAQPGTPTAAVETYLADVAGPEPRGWWASLVQAIRGR